MQVIEITPKNINKVKKVRLAAYCRVSSDSEDQIHSFHAQIQYYTNYVKEHPEYELVDIYMDEGLTGTEMGKREEFDRLLRDCKKGKIDKIIVKSVSRFMRNIEELLITVRMLKEMGVSIYFETQGIDSTKLNSEMILSFPGMIAQQESENISGNLRWGIRKRMERGEFICSHMPYGYSLVNGKMVINEIEAESIRLIFKMYLEGFGTIQITRALNQQGVLYARGNRCWKTSAIKYILSNERYIGDAVLQKFYTTDVLPYRVKKNKGEKKKYYVENYCPAIITKEDFDKVQELLKKRTPKNLQKETYPLTKLIRCPDCGRTFRRQVIKGKAYWACSKDASGASNCTSRRVREDMVYECFINMLYKLKNHREDLIESTIKRFEFLQSKANQNQEQISAIDKEIADLNAKNLVLTKLHSNGILGTAEFSEQSSSIGNRLTQLRAERRKKLMEDETLLSLEDLRTLNESVKEYSPTSEFDEEIFNQIVEKIKVDTEFHVTFCLIGGIELTEEIIEKGRSRIA